MDLILRAANPARDARLGLQQALLDFRTVLTPDERASLEQALASTSAPTAASILELTRKIDANSGRRTRRVGARLQPFLNGVQQFTAIVDAFVGLGPSIAEAIWGVVKVALVLASNASSYFEKLSELLKTVGDDCPRYQDYALLYSGSRQLQNALCAYFEQVIHLARQAVKISRTPAAVRLVRTAFWPFDAEFGPIQTSIADASKQVAEEVQLSSAKLQIEEAELDKLERKDASDARKLLATFSTSTRNELAEMKHRWQSYDDRQRRRSVLQVMARLCAFDHTREWRRIYKQGAVGTAEWFLQDSIYQDWLSKPSGTLLLVGTLGSGKSVLAANIVTSLRTRPSEEIAYFFCPNSMDTTITANSLCCSIMGQLIERSLDILPIDVLDQFMTWSASQSWRRILETYAAVLKPIKAHCIIVDNLDYLDANAITIVLQNIQEIGEALAVTANVKILLSVRPGMDVTATKTLPLTSTLRIARPLSDADIKMFVEAALTEKVDAAQLVLSDISLIGQISEYIVQGADGMFLWAHLVLEQICYHNSDVSIVESLRQLPTKLSDMFELMLDQTCRGSKYGFLRKLFMWSIGARRPLSLDELAQALSLERGQSQLCSSRGRQEVIAAITTTRGLLYLDTDELTVSPVHHSFRQYLLQERVKLADATMAFSLSTIDAELGHLAMMYLTLVDFGAQLVKGNPTLDIARASLKILPAAHKALAIESKTAQSIIKVRHVISRASLRSVSPEPGKGSTQAVEARLGELFLQMAEKTMKQKQHISQYPFLEYARGYWYTHTAALSPDSDEASWALFMSLFKSREDRYEQPWYDDVPPDPSISMDWANPDSKKNITELWDDEERGAVSWASENAHFAVLEAQFTILNNPGRQALWKDMNTKSALQRLDHTLLARSLAGSEAAALICRNPGFWLLDPDKDGGRGSRHYIDSLVVLLAVRFNLPKYLDIRTGFSQVITEGWKWNESELDKYEFLKLQGESPYLAQVRSDPSQLQPDGDNSLITKDLRVRGTSNVSYSQMAILYGNNDVFHRIQASLSDPTALIDLAFTALFWQNFDIAEFLSTKIRQLPHPRPLIPSSLIVLAIWNSRIDIATTLSETKYNSIVRAEFPPGIKDNRWARISHSLWPPSPDEASKLDHEMLEEALRHAFARKAIHLFYLLASSYIRPYRFPPSHKIPQALNDIASKDPAEAKYTAMVKIYGQILVRTPSARGSDQMMPFYLWLVMLEAYVLPVVFIVRVLAPMEIETATNVIFTGVLVSGVGWVLVAMLLGCLFLPR